MQMEDTTANMEYSFVGGQDLPFDVDLFESSWKIHDKWLTFEGAHQDTVCDQESRLAGDGFSCDHAVLQLWDKMLARVRSDPAYVQITKHEGRLKDLARIKLLQMPRSVKCRPGPSIGKMVVTWKCVDPQWEDAMVKVVLHNRDCDSEDCGCASQTTKARLQEAIFERLDINQRYIAKIKRDIEHAWTASSLGRMPPQTVGSAGAPPEVPEVSSRNIGKWN